jgi:hypothetical protein
MALGCGDVERQQPGGRRVDRHRGVHAVERDALEELFHVGEAEFGRASCRERV